MRKIAEMLKHTVVIGGGAAGFFAAVNLSQMDPDCQVTILEKGNKVLSKVRISGGGRCNVTHACFDDAQLVRHYPRGAKALRGAFSRFTTTDTINWFQERGVSLKAEADGRMFPVTDNSATIIDCLMDEASRYGVQIKLGADVKNISKTEAGFLLEMNGGGQLKANCVVIASGGNPKNEAYNWLRELGHTIRSPVPSLFTFNVPDRTVTSLMGLSVADALIRLDGLPYSNAGPLLITHWGFSGPAVLKLSAWAARELNQCNYQFGIRISWIGEKKEEELRNRFAEARERWNTRYVSGHPLFELPRRLWEHLVSESDIAADLRWADLPKKNMNKLIESLLNDSYTVKGKTTFKEEFVTCGGIDLGEVNFRSMESLICKNLFFAGEVLDMDGVTGGFNFQAAWTTGYIAAKAIALSDKA
jgi:predicted Rossmann fold flavoprotein